MKEDRMKSNAEMPASTDDRYCETLTMHYGTSFIKLMHSLCFSAAKGFEEDFM